MSKDTKKFIDPVTNQPIYINSSSIYTENANGVIIEVKDLKQILSVAYQNQVTMTQGASGGLISMTKVTEDINHQKANSVSFPVPIQPIHKRYDKQRPSAFGNQTPQRPQHQRNQTQIFQSTSSSGEEFQKPIDMKSFIKESPGMSSQYKMFDQSPQLFSNRGFLGDSPVISSNYNQGVSTMNAYQQSPLFGLYQNEKSPFLCSRDINDNN